MSRWDFWDWCMAGALTVGLVAAVLVTSLYLVPRHPLAVPELQSALRIGRADDFPSNSGSLQRWGRELIIVIRGPGGEFSAVRAVSPADGCVLRWDEVMQSITSPCSYAVYNQWGAAIRGLSNRALQTYPIENRDGFLTIRRPR